MWIRASAAVAIVAAGGMIGGCASDGNFIGPGLTTSSIEPPAVTSAAQPKVDPQCVALMSKIDQLRKEGTPGRIEKISTGKSATATVKRQALARITELDKSNAEFQSRCSTMSPAQQAAVRTAPAAVASEAAVAATDQGKQAATSAAKKAATKTATKTVAKAAATPATEASAAAAAAKPAASAAE